MYLKIKWPDEMTVYVQCYELNTCGVTSDEAQEIKKKKQKKK